MRAQILVVGTGNHQVVQKVEAFALEGEVGLLDLSVDGSVIAAASREAFASPNADPNALKFFDAKTGRVLLTESGSSSRVLALRFTPDGRHFIESGFNNRTQIWDWRHERQLQEIAVESQDVAVSRDSRFMAIADDKTVLIFEFTPTN